MNKKMIAVIAVTATLLTGCSATQEAANKNSSPETTVAAVSAIDLKTWDAIAQEEKATMREVIAEAKHEEKRKAEEARIVEEQRIAAEAQAKAEEEVRIVEQNRLEQEKAEQEKQAAARKQASPTNPVAPQAPAANTPVTPAKPATTTGLLPGESGFDWINRMQRQYGVYAYPGTEFSIRGSTRCHAFAPQALGCTTQELDPDTMKPSHKGIKVVLTPGSIGNPYVLFHEIAHSQGIMDDCQADIFSRNVTGIPGGYYC